MSISTEIENIARQLGGQFNQEDIIYHGSGLGFGNLHTSIYSFTFEHKGVLISFSNDFGGFNVGKLNCKIKNPKLQLPFHFRTKGPWQQLFSRISNPIIIDSKNKNLKKYLERNINYIKLNAASKQYRFEPEIKGYYFENEFYIK